MSPKSTDPKDSFDIVIVGGVGHVGLPLGLVLADQGSRVCLLDINQDHLEKVQKGEMPFLEYDAEPILQRVLEKTLFVSSDPQTVSRAKIVIIAIGTPVDEYLNPKVMLFLNLFKQLKPHLNNQQTLIIRSTIYPRTCHQVLRVLGQEEGPWHLAYCPERIVQGYAIRELAELPQIVAGVTEKAIQDSTELFSKITAKIIPLALDEAELVKLFTNAWRYFQFAVANQFYMVSHDFGVDFNRVREAMVEGYGRAGNLPRAGFAAGPCLLKDTMQISAFNGNRFQLGQAAMAINEGLPHFIVEDLKKRYRLSDTKVGILGMAFKADIDDIRDSLSYKLGKILRFYGTQVYYSDEFAQDPTFISKEELIQKSEIVIVGVPHTPYKGLEISSQVEVVDLWGVVQGGKRIIK
jgi:UDP-N-acetyl-D-mannosaminuronic acid dehydrogenase